eukprot:scaffold98893_cov54-Attheya_sp.AAC.1
MKLFDRFVKYSIPAALFAVGLCEPVRANNGLRATAAHDFDHEDIDIIDFAEHEFINSTNHELEHDFPNDYHVNITMSRQLLPVGQLTYNAVSGMWVLPGVSVREIARTGSGVKLVNGGTSSTRFHSLPDGAHCFSKSDGWICLSNSEEKRGGGGVYAMAFNSNGDPTAFSQKLGGTTRNCAGGATPHNTWISCEETGRGYCWEVNPHNGETKVLKGLTGRTGRFEAFDCETIPNFTKTLTQADFLNAMMIKLFLLLYRVVHVQAYYQRSGGTEYFVTEDHKQGALTRKVGNLNEGGSLSYLVFSKRSRTYTWSNSLNDGRKSAKRFYPGSEGVTVHGNDLYFISKKKKALFKLNLNGNNYSQMRTGNPMSGYGAFTSGPDNVHSVGAHSLYFTEQGKTPGVFVMDTNTLRYSTVFQFSGKGETTGISFNPSRTIMYACEQRTGIMYEFKAPGGTQFD